MNSTRYPGGFVENILRHKRKGYYALHSSNEMMVNIFIYSLIHFNKIEFSTYQYCQALS